MDNLSEKLTDLYGEHLYLNADFIAEHYGKVHLIVDCSIYNVPPEFAGNVTPTRQLTLNITPTARGLMYTTEGHLFLQLRKAGKALELFIPLDALMAVCDPEAKMALMFDLQVFSNVNPAVIPVSDKPKRPTLTLVKGDSNE